MAFKDIAKKAKGKAKGGKPDMEAEDAMGKFKDDNPFPKGGKGGKKGGFKAAVKNAKKKCKGKKC